MSGGRMRAVVVDLLCDSPFYDAALVASLRQNGVEAELASPRFYLERDYLDPFPRSSWIVDLTVHLSHPRAVRLGTRAVELPVNLVRLCHAVKAGEYHVVHVEWIPLEHRQTAFMGLLRAACDRAGVPLVLTVHNVLPHDSPTASRAVIRRNLDLADLVIAHTDHVARQLQDLLAIQAPITIVPHGVMFADTELPGKERAMTEQGLEGDPVVLFAGLVRPYKGVDLLAEAWPAVRSAFPDAALVVAGSALGDEARSQLRSLAELPGVRVTNGYVPMAEMLNYYAASDLVVFPYRSISQSGALMTAVGLGRPCVVTPIPGFVEQTTTLSSVAFAEAVSGPAIAQTTISALQDRVGRLAAAAEDRLRVAESPLGWPSVGRETTLVYERAIAGLR
jgi:glycosyltransferase involved in cell wall biosynthesis